MNLTKFSSQQKRTLTFISGACDKKENRLTAGSTSQKLVVTALAKSKELSIITALV